MLDIADGVCIMTDSLCSIRLVAAYAARPESLRHHKRCTLITEFAQKLLACTAPVYLVKIRSHCGVTGNDQADALAQSVRTNAAIPAYSFRPSHIRGRAWVQVPFGSTFSNADNLSDQLLHVTQEAFCIGLWADLIPPDLRLCNTLAGLRPIALEAWMQTPARHSGRRGA